MAVNPPGNYRLGSVAQPLSEQEVHLAEDGEVLVRGSTLQKIEIPDRTPFTSDGFYATGDLGRFDEDGYLYLLGRQWEITKTSNGRQVALPALETHFRDAPGIDQFVVFGHGRPHLVALISLVPGCSRDPARLAVLIEKCNALLPRHERLSGGHLLDKALTPLKGELTLNLKMRRSEIEKKYGASSDSLYKKLVETGREDKVIVQ